MKIRLHTELNYEHTPEETEAFDQECLWSDQATLRLYSELMGDTLGNVRVLRVDRSQSVLSR